MLIFVMALLLSRMPVVPVAASSFLTGAGAALALVGAGKRATELLSTR